MSNTGTRNHGSALISDCPMFRTPQKRHSRFRHLSSTTMLDFRNTGGMTERDPSVIIGRATLRLFFGHNRMTRAPAGLRQSVELVRLSVASDAMQRSPPVPVGGQLRASAGLRQSMPN